MASELQNANEELLHHLQFGCVRGRSAIDAVFRQVAKAQRCLAHKGRAGWGLWDVKGAFQNTRLEVVLDRMDKSKSCRKWIGWMVSFFRERHFKVAWDGEIHGTGKSNMGVPQGSPLSPMAFLIFMAPILEEMQARLSQEFGPRLDIEVPSYVDDILVSVLDWKGKRELKRTLRKVDQLINEVAHQWSIPLEKDKHEEIIFRGSGKGSGRKKKRADVARVKWLGVIIDENLYFDHHWRSRIAKARGLLGSFCSLGNSQWGVSPTSWRQLYTGMIRVMALWGAEIAWRGQKAWRKDFERLQYQALRTCTGAIIGSDMEKVNKLAAVEDVDTILEAGQMRFMARSMGDPSTSRDIWDSALVRAIGRQWTDHSALWHHSEVAFGKDGYESIAVRLLGRLEVELGECISWGGRVERVQCREIDLQCSASTPANKWQLAIDGTCCETVFTDGSMSEQGVVGGGYHFSQGSLGVRVGLMATVWDGEIAGLERGLRAAEVRGGRILLLTDSKAAIQAVKKAGHTGRARTRALAALLQMIGHRNNRLWPAVQGEDTAENRLHTDPPGEVCMAWVKAHIGVEGNEKADRAAKEGADKGLYYGGEVTEGGVRQRARELRKENRRAAGYLCIANWDRHSATTYTHLRTNKGDLQ